LVRRDVHRRAVIDEPVSSACRTVRRPGAPDLPPEFQKRRGYELQPILPDLVLRPPGPNTARHRHDFWLTVGELVSEHFFGQIQEECRRLGVPSGAIFWRRRTSNTCRCTAISSAVCGDGRAEH
jgi:hypothetical protein